MGGAPVCLANYDDVSCSEARLSVSTGSHQTTSELATRTVPRR